MRPSLGSPSVGSSLTGQKNPAGFRRLGREVQSPGWGRLRTGEKKKALVTSKKETGLWMYATERPEARS